MGPGKRKVQGMQREGTIYSDGDSGLRRLQGGIRKKMKQKMNLDGRGNSLCPRRRANN